MRLAKFSHAAVSESSLIGQLRQARRRGANRSLQTDEQSSCGEGRHFEPPRYASKEMIGQMQVCDARPQRANDKKSQVSLSNGGWRSTRREVKQALSGELRNSWFLAH